MFALCQQRTSHRVMPAMQLGIADRVWRIGELAETALHRTIAGPGGNPHGLFAAIDGGCNGRPVIGADTGNPVVDCDRAIWDSDIQNSSANRQVALVDCLAAVVRGRSHYRAVGHHLRPLGKRWRRSRAVLMRDISMILGRQPATTAASYGASSPNSR